MAKPPADELLAAVADDFHTYLRRGVRFDRVIGAAHPELDIDDIDTLLRIHFVLTESGDEPGDVGVVDFIRALEDRIRRMKTTTEPNSVTRRGEVRGHIDWQQTIKKRSRTGRLDEPLFVSNQPEEDYNIDENLVLKRLLTVIREILTEDLEYAITNPERYEWLDAWTARADTGAAPAAVESTAAMFERVFERNVYLQRIDVRETELTDWTIEAVKQSRSVFYQQAATLLDRYRRLMRQELDSEDARAILNQTLIAPDEPEVLFELYWLFQILDAYEGVQYRVLTDDRAESSVIAAWEHDGVRYVMSHDATGRSVRFNESIDPGTVEPDGYLYRMNEVLAKWQSLSAQLLDRSGQGSLWGGRPDILLERFEPTEQGDWELEQVFVGEVKYTSDANYATAGLRELLEYMAFVKQRGKDSDYVEHHSNLLKSVEVKGLLFVGTLDIDATSPDVIDIVQYSDADTLDTVL